MKYTMIFFAITTLIWVYLAIYYYQKKNIAEDFLIKMFLENEKLKKDLGNAPEELLRLTTENMRLERELQRKIWKWKKK